jgi:mono/diheme cytochrome c family protein
MKKGQFMGARTKAIIATLVAFAVGLSYLGVAIARHGFSAREKPSWLETVLARQARRIATPAGAKELKNPYPVTADSLAAARAHWVDHCASCHGLDGSGDTLLGRNLYPKPPDMRDPTVQQLSDGELFTIIQNGVRFTGMPAWGGEHTPEQTWQLVAFIRRLPSLSAEELNLMEQFASGASAAGGHTHGLETQPHTHGR